MTNLRVLFVDDERSLLEQAEIFLKKENEGLDIDPVLSADEALEKIDEESYDVIVSDYQMPKMNGLEFLRILRKERGTDIPFIVFTGKGREEVAINALNLGADRYLQKGGDPRAQYRILAQAINQEVKHYKTKENLEARKKQFEKALKHAPYPAVLHAEDGEVISINDVWIEISGYGKDEISTIYDWTEKAYGEKRDLVETDIKKLYDIEGRVDEGIYTIKTKDGERRRWKFSSSPLGSLPDGRRLILSMANDITEQMKAEENLKKSEEKYHAITEKSHDTIFIVGEENFLFVNDRTCELTGYSKEELYEMNFWEVLHPDDVEKVMNIDHKGRKGKDVPTKYEARVLTKDGEVRYGDFRVTPIEYEGEFAVLGTVRDITERKKAEKKLRKSEKRYRNFFKTSKDCAFITSKDGRWIDMSDSAPEFFGYDSKEELREVRVPDIYKDAKSRKEHIQKIEEKGFLKEYQVDLVKKDGSVIHTLITSVPIEEEGDVKGYQGIIRDITERMEREKEFEEIKTRYDALFERSMDLVFINDLEGNFLDANRAALDLLGYDKDEIDGLNFSDLLSEDQLEKAFGMIDTIIESGTQDYLSTFKLKKRDGGEVLVETKSSMIYEDGEPTAMLGIGRDFTDQREVQERLMEKEKQLKELHGVASKLVVADSEEEICRLAVDAAEEILEFEVCGLDFVEDRMFVPKAMSSSVGEDGYISRPVEEGGLSKKTYLNKRSYLIEDLLENTDAKPVKNDYRSAISIPVGDFGIFQAISTTVGRYDQEDLEMAELLMSHVSEALERIKTKEREDFLHSMLRHDVRNKSQIVHGYLELLEDYDLPEEVSEHVEKAVKATREGVDIIEKVKKLRRIEEKDEIGEVNIGVVLDKVLSEHEDQSKDEGIDIDMEECDCVVMGGQLLKELFSNLVENCIKHSSCDSIVVRTRSLDGECVVTVEDNGKGIEEDVKDRIFEKGFRSGESGGSGLGMYMVKEIAENYGGRVELKDSESGGARFDVRLKKV